MDNLTDKTFWAFSFHISTIGYLEKGFSCSINVTDMELTVEPTVINNPSQIVADFEKEIVKKKNKLMAKKKKRLAKLYTLIGSRLSFCPRSSTVLLSYYISVLVFHPRFPAVLLFCRMLTLVSCPRSCTVLLFCYMPAPISCPRSLVILLSCYIPAPTAFATFFLPHHTLVSGCKISALLLPLFMPNPLFILRSLFFRTFKWSLLDKLWLCMSTSLAKFFCLFAALGV